MENTIAYQSPSKKREKKLRNLNLKEKVQVIKMVNEEKKNIKEVTAIYQCGKTQIYNIMKNKDEIMNKFLLSSKFEMKQIKYRESKYRELNKILFDWYSSINPSNCVMSGPIIKEKAKEVAKTLKLDTFTASNGWLASFRRRHNISFKEPPNKDENDEEKQVIENWDLPLTEYINCEIDLNDVIQSVKNENAEMMENSQKAKKDLENIPSQEQIKHYIEEIKRYAKGKGESDIFDKVVQLEISFLKSKKDS